MRTRGAFVALLVSLLCSPVFAADHSVPEPEHTVWVKIDAEPVGTVLFAKPPEGETPSTRIGTTPCIVAADFTWGQKWLRKRWELVKVWSPADVCRAEMQQDGTCVLYVSFVAMKDGYQPTTVDVPVALLRNPGKDWAGKARWPTEGAVSFKLDRVPGQAARPPPAHRIMVAGGGSESAGTGTITITADTEGAVVFIDQMKVGTTPIQLVLKEGDHLVEVRKPGCRTLKQRVHIEADARVSYRAVLNP